MSEMINEMIKMMREAVQIKARMDADKARLSELNAAIAEAASFKEGSKTGRAAAGPYVAKVQLRETVSWDQKALCHAVKVMGVEEFRKGFTFEYKPRSAKLLKDWLADPATSDEWRKLITGARVVKAGSPSVSIEHIGDAEEA